MDEKKQLIAYFENQYWPIDTGIQHMLMSLSLDQLQTKIAEWIAWSQVRQIEFAGGAV